MKKQIKYLSIAFIAPFLLFTGCDDGDKIANQIFDEAARGVALRTIEVLDNEIAINLDGSLDPAGRFAVILEEQDQEDGALLGSVEVFIGFEDNTSGGVDNSTAEVLAETIPASSFSPGEFGLPVIEYAISGQEMQTVLGLSGDQIMGGDQFSIRFEVVLTDGRRFSAADNTGTLTGNFFRSPFLYNATIVCPPIPPTAGTWTIVQNDSYGDSWNGASLDVTIDGTTTSFAHEGGASTTFEFEVPAGAAEIQIVYNSGNFDGENTFTVTSASGTTVLDLGPSPLAGAALFNFCLDLDL